MEVNHMVESDKADADRKLKSALEDLSAACNRYVTISKGAGSGSGVGKTKLDKERMKMCQKELVCQNTTFCLFFSKLILEL